MRRIDEKQLFGLLFETSRLFSRRNVRLHDQIGGYGIVFVRTHFRSQREKRHAISFARFENVDSIRLILSILQKY